MWLLKELQPEQKASPKTSPENSKQLSFNCLPGLPWLEWSSVTAAIAIANVITVNSNQLRTRFRGLLFLPELIMLPATLIFPQFSMSALRPGDRGTENRMKGRKKKK